MCNWLSDWKCFKKTESELELSFFYLVSKHYWSDSESQLHIIQPLMFNKPAYAYASKGKYWVRSVKLPKNKWATVKICFIDIKTPPPSWYLSSKLGNITVMYMYEGNMFLVASLPLNILILEFGCPADWHRIIKSAINMCNGMIWFFQ